MLDEPGTDEARDVFASATWIQSSALLVPEAHAAIARATRDRRLGASGKARSLDLLRDLLAQVERIELDVTLADRAGELATLHGLRGSDAVHLASFERTAGAGSVLVAADGDLVRVARSLGHAVAVPGA